MRCKGKTKAGTRCKRNATDDAEFCGMHADQGAAQDTSESADPTPEPEMFSDESNGTEFDLDEWWVSVREVVIVGTVIVAALTLGRIIR